MASQERLIYEHVVTPEEQKATKQEQEMKKAEAQVKQKEATLQGQQQALTKTKQEIETMEESLKRREAGLEELATKGSVHRYYRRGYGPKPREISVRLPPGDPRTQREYKRKYAEYSVQHQRYEQAVESYNVEAERFKGSVQEYKVLRAGYETEYAEYEKAYNRYAEAWESVSRWRGSRPARVPVAVKAAGVPPPKPPKRAPSFTERISRGRRTPTSRVLERIPDPLLSQRQKRLLEEKAVGQVGMATKGAAGKFVAGTVASVESYVRPGPEAPTVPGATISSIQKSFKPLPFVELIQKTAPPSLVSESRKAEIVARTPKTFQPTLSEEAKSLIKMGPMYIVGELAGEAAQAYFMGKVVGKVAGKLARTKTGQRISSKIPDEFKNLFTRREPVLQVTETTREITGEGAELTLKRFALASKKVSQRAMRSAGKREGLTAGKALMTLEHMGKKIKMEASLQRGLLSPTGDLTFGFAWKKVSAKGVTAEAIKASFLKSFFGVGGKDAGKPFYTLIRGTPTTPMAKTLGRVLGGAAQQTLQKTASQKAVEATLKIVTTPSVASKILPAAAAVASKEAAKSASKEAAKAKASMEAPFFAAQLPRLWQRPAAPPSIVETGKWAEPKTRQYPQETPLDLPKPPKILLKSFEKLETPQALKTEQQLVPVPETAQRYVSRLWNIQVQRQKMKRTDLILGSPTMTAAPVKPITVAPLKGKQRTPQKGALRQAPKTVPPQIIDSRLWPPQAVPLFRPKPKAKKGKRGGFWGGWFGRLWPLADPEQVWKKMFGVAKKKAGKTRRRSKGERRR